MIERAKATIQVKEENHLEIKVELKWMRMEASHGNLKLIKVVK